MPGLILPALQPFTDRGVLLAALQQEVLHEQLALLRLDTPAHPHRWLAELPAGVLTLSLVGPAPVTAPGRALVAKIELLAAVVPGARAALWGWAHPKGKRESPAARRLREAGERAGIPELMNEGVAFPPGFDCADEERVAALAHEMGAAAMGILGAMSAAPPSKPPPMGPSSAPPPKTRPKARQTGTGARRGTATTGAPSPSATGPVLSAAPCYYSASTGPGGTRLLFLIQETDPPLPPISLTVLAAKLPRLAATLALADPRAALVFVAERRGWGIEAVGGGQSGGVRMNDGKVVVEVGFDNVGRVAAIHASP